MSIAVDSFAAAHAVAIGVAAAVVIVLVVGVADYYDATLCLLLWLC
jgi:hypothetical protein